jgi:thiol:disulfide interchange protein DsbC
LYEVRIGSEILYTDEQGNHLIQGSLIDTRTRANLTEERIEKLTAIDFSTLPFKDAVVIKQGSGARKMVVFGDPNCGYCKRFERDLATLKDVTIYTFLYPILGPDSTVKSRDIWCAKDSAKVWRSWMVDGVTPPKNVGSCDTAALDRNVELGRKYRVQGTPAVVFENGVRKPGALPAAQIEQLLVAASKKS